MTLAEQADLMKDDAFRQRIKAAALHFADYIVGEATDAPAHNTRVTWARKCQTQPEQTSYDLQPNVVMDAAVQQDGAAILDPDLQSAVENTVNKLM